MRIGIYLGSFKPMHIGHEQVLFKVAELNDKDNSCVIETSAGKIKFDRSAISMEMSSKLNAPVAKK